MNTELINRQALSINIISRINSLYTQCASLPKDEDVKTEIARADILARASELSSILEEIGISVNTKMQDNGYPFISFCETRESPYCQM